MDEKRFVTLDQLVETFPFLKKSRVYYLTTAKGIPFYRVGRSLVFEITRSANGSRPGGYTDARGAYGATR